MIEADCSEIQIVINIKIILSLVIAGYFFNPINIYSGALVND